MAFVPDTPVRRFPVRQEYGPAKDELISMEGLIEKILPDACFVGTFEQERPPDRPYSGRNPPLPYSIGRKRPRTSRNAPHDLAKGRIVSRKRVPGHGPGVNRPQGNGR
jgi:translation initiation factor IF-1